MLPEFWLRGRVEGVPGPLQPVAHALLQAREEILQAITGFPEISIWDKPAGVASVAFHLRHITGVLDRLFTYANGKQLDQQQLDYLASEAKPDTTIQLASLMEDFNRQVDNSIEQLRHTDEKTLQEHRGVGRKQLPSTVAGLLFHAAEHTMRHTGQLLVTVRVIIDK